MPVVKLVDVALEAGVSAATVSRVLNNHPTVDPALAKRVKEVNLADLQEPQATIEDSGSRISITLARDDLSKSLKSALEAVAGKGDRVKSVNAAGVYPVLEYIGAN